MNHFITKTLLALGVAATVTVGAVNPTISAPLASSGTANNASLNEAATSDVIEVRRRHRGRYVAGALLGLGAAALIYEGSRRHRHSGYYYGGHPGYYGYGGGYGYRDCIRRHGRLYCSGY